MKKKISFKLIGGALALAWVLVLSACTSSAPEVGTEIGELETGIEDALTSEIVSLTINDKYFYIDLTRNNDLLDAKTLNAEYDTKFKNYTENKDIEIYINGQLLEDEIFTNIGELSYDNTVQLDIVFEDVSRRYDIRTIPSNFPDITLEGDYDFDGDYYFDVAGASYVIKMASDGQILFYYSEGTAFYPVMNLEKWNIDGQVFYSFFEPVDGYDEYIIRGETYGQIIVMNEKYEVMQKIQLLATDTIDAFPVENHAFLLIDENHYVVSGSMDKTVQIDGYDNTTVIKASYFQEVLDGEVIFEWDSTMDDRFYAASVESNDYTNTEVYASDYTHINSIDIDPNDGNFIVSLRNTDTVVKINHDTAETMWVLGGLIDEFGLTNEQLFSRQHYAKFIDDHTILLFDNGNAKQLTRLLTFVLDEENMTVTEFGEVSYDDRWSIATGSAQLTSEGYYVFGWGYGTDGHVLTVYDNENDVALSEISIEVDDYAYRSRIFE